MKTIKVTYKDEEIYAIIDDEDYNEVSKHKWCLTNKGYAHSRINGHLVKMHRFVMGLYNNIEYKMIDHIDNCKLNNQKSNLRTCTFQENTYNRKRNNSKHKGVSQRSNGNWRVRIYKSGNLMVDKTFKDELEAVKYYNSVIFLYHGEFSYYNKEVI